MIKLKELLTDRGYRTFRSSNGIVYTKKVEDTTLDVLTKRIHIIIRVSGMYSHIYRFLEGKTLKDYITSLGFDYFRSAGPTQIALIKKTNFSTTQLSNKAAKSLSEFLDKYENPSTITPIREKIQEMIDKIAAGDDSIEEVRKYNEIKKFAESKGMKVESSSAELSGNFKASSYDYSL